MSGNDSLMDQLERGEENIHVTHAEFTPEEFSVFAREIRDVETVKTLLLRANKIDDQMVLQLAQSLSRNRSIKEIFLSENLIGDTGAKALAEALQNNKTLQILYLNENSISDEGAEHLMHALQVNTTLQQLFLLHNPITIDTTLIHKMELRQEYARLLALCALGIPRLAKKCTVQPLPQDILRLVKKMLSNSWSDGFSRRGKA